MLARRSLAILGIVSACAVGALFGACTGDDPMLTSAGDASTADGPTDAANGQDTSTSPSDGGSEAAFPACGVADTTPCNCGPAKSCCVGTGTAACYERGTEDQDAASGCTSTTTMNCVGTNCVGGNVCCFNGSLTKGTVCPYRLTAFDTRCEPVANADGGHPCTDTSNGFVHELLCDVDADCEKYDAGVCRPALMDSVNRVMNVCVR